MLGILGFLAFAASAELIDEQAQICIDFTKHTKRECGMFIYTDETVSAPTLGTATRVKIMPDYGQQPAVFIHTHPHSDWPHPSDTDRKVAAAAASQCRNMRLIVYSMTGHRREYTFPFKPEHCEGKR